MDGGHQTLERLREAAPDAELDAQQHEALAAFAAQRTLERRFLAEMRRRPIAPVALDFRESANATAARVCRTFTATGASACAGYPYLR